jgi:hypothetical protein
MAVVAKLYFAPDAYLELDVADNGWCRCTVVHNHTRLYLGAEVVKWVAIRLLHSIEVANDPMGEADTLFMGHTFTWGLSLSERHFRLHTTESDGCRILQWIDATNGNLSIVMHLTKERCGSWSSQLSDILLPWRKELLYLVQGISRMLADDDRDRLQEAVRDLERKPIQRGASDVIFNPTSYGLGSQPTPEELLDAILRYKPKKEVT